MEYLYAKDNKNDGYVAPYLGNGTMTFETDYEGTMEVQPDKAGIKSNSDMRIWWAGRRYLHKPELIPFGFFGQRFSGELTAAKQELDTKKALSVSRCSYTDGREITSTVLIHHDFNLIAVKKEFAADEPFVYSFDYMLADIEDDKSLPELMEITDVKERGSVIEIDYRLKTAIFPCSGRILVFTDGDAETEVCGNRFSLKKTVKDCECVFYLLFCDSIEDEDYKTYADGLYQKAIAEGFDGLLREHTERWSEYLSESYAKIGDEKIDSVYETAQYHIKCYATPWSIPVGLNNGSWHGRFFAFDEFYILMGLLTSNHLSVAKKIPSFRYDGLTIATDRVSARDNEPMARYPWETLENGTEGAPNGFFRDHVFHMACIALGQYYYCKFSQDTEYLKHHAYVVIKRCAQFYMSHMIYETSRGYIVGKCTDLERLGASRENAYMTTCGVIATLNVFSELARLLGVDEEMAKTADFYKDELYKALPTKDGQYIPYYGCEAKSIGLLSGTYPFDVIERDSELQKKGIESYLKSETTVGNMYSVGRGVCSWYKTWKALAFARLDRAEEAFEAVKEAAENSGYFGEMYEINDMETMTIYRPWFTTAAGMLVHAVNEILLQSRDRVIYIAPALPKSVTDFSFKLATYDGVTVEAVAENGALKKLVIDGADNAKVILPSHIKQRL